VQIDQTCLTSVHAAAATNVLQTDNFTVMLQPLSVATRLKWLWTSNSTT